MGEDLNPSQNHYVPTDAELDEGGRKFADPFLTDEELEKLLTREDKGITPAPQYQYADLEDFKRGQNNFHAYFDLGNRGIGPLYRRRKSFQRLAALQPELVERTVDQYRKYHTESDYFSDFSHEMWSELYEAYKSMSQLVDVNDSYVIREEDGRLDDHFLIR